MKKEFEVKEVITKKVYLRKSWRLRGIEETDTSKRVVAEKPFCNMPTQREITQFLYDHKDASFCVVEEVFCLDDDMETMVEGA